MLTQAHIDRVEAKLKLAYSHVQHLPNTDQFIVGKEGVSLTIGDVYGNVIVPPQRQVWYDLHKNKLDGTYIVFNSHISKHSSNQVAIYSCNTKSFYTLGDKEATLGKTALILRVLGEVTEEYGDSQYWKGSDEEPDYTLEVSRIFDITGKVLIPLAVAPQALGWRFIEYEDFDNKFRYDRVTGQRTKLRALASY